MYEIPSLGLIPDVTGDFMVLQEALYLLGVAWLAITVVGFLVILPLASRQSAIGAPLEVEALPATSPTRPAVPSKAPRPEPGIVVRLLETLEVHRTTASEVFFALCAIGGLAMLVRTLVAHLA